MAITKLLRLKESKKGNPAQHLINNILYICDREKTDGGLWIGGNAGQETATIISTMLRNKKVWNKQDSQVDMVTDVYSHIIDEDRRKNAELFEEAFYKRKNLNPNVYGIHSQEPEPTKVTVPDNIDPVLLQKVLSNPEMAALVSALAATMEK